MMSLDKEVSFSARSHPGHVRTNNEDNLYLNGMCLTPQTRNAPFSAHDVVKVPCLFAVCDGMGGEEDGELASLTAVTALNEHAEAIKAAALSGSLGGLDRDVQSFVTDANKRLCDIMVSRAVRMGTTLALAAVMGNTMRCYTIGDSRIYALRGGKLYRLSEDHTMAVQKIKMRMITAEEAKRDKDRHVLTRYLGVFEDEMTPAADALGPFLARGRLLLCSDGLTEMVEDRDIEAMLRAATNAESAADALVDRALRNGGRDNVTCIVIDFEGVKSVERH